MKEIKRVANWWSGDYPCERCGKVLTLYYNGGELDFKECCGLTYQTVEVQVDLVISGEEE